MQAPFGPVGICANGALILAVPSLAILHYDLIRVSVVQSVVQRLRRRVSGVSVAIESLDDLVGEPFILSEVLRDAAPPVDDVIASMPTPVL